MSLLANPSGAPWAGSLAVAGVEAMSVTPGAAVSFAVNTYSG